MKLSAALKTNHRHGSDDERHACGVHHNRRQEFEISFSTILLLAAWGSCCACFTPTHAVAQLPNEHHIKAAMVFNIAKYVDFPSDFLLQGRGPLHICTMGKGPFTQALEDLQGKTVRGHPITIQQIRTVDDIAACHLLAISDSQRYQLPAILEKSAQLGVLTISDTRKFAQTGGVIGLFSQNDKILFEVNLEAARNARLKISSQLLKLARIVRNE